VPDRPLEIRWLKRALANLDAEAAFIALDHPAAAARLVDTIADRRTACSASRPGPPRARRGHSRVGCRQYPLPGPLPRAQ